MKDRHFSLAIEYCPNAKRWAWLWIRAAVDPDDTPEILCCRTGFTFILDAYQDAARWAMTHAPIEITNVVCAVKH